MKLGILGLPNVGKSALFNSLTRAGAESGNYPFSTVKPNIGAANVPDKRLIELAKLYNSEKITYAAIEFVDIAGLAKGASSGEGLGNKFLSHIREADALVHVVRCFDNENVMFADDSIDTIRDIEIIDLELILADLETVERRLGKTAKSVRTDKSLQGEFDLLTDIKTGLEDGICVRNMDLGEESAALVQSFNLLTSKPVIYAVNVNEGDLLEPEEGNIHVTKVKEHALKEGSEYFVICARLEEEISQLDEEEREMFLKDLGVETSGLDKLIVACYSLLGLISFLTAGPKEARAWTIKKGSKAPQAAGKIHSDLERGFIRAEIVSYNDLIRLGAYSLAKEKGLVRLEGKEYVVKDEDVILFRFNV